VVALAGSTGAAAAPALAQDTTQGVRIGLAYDRSGKPGVALTQVTGPNADSVRAILARDFDFSDRITVIPPDSGPAPSGALNYDLYAKLNAVAVVQASVTPAGALHVAVHEVSQKRVVSVIDIALPAPALSAEWRQVVHVAADSVEFTVLGQKGIASTRILFSRNSQIWSVDSDGANAQPVSGTEGGLSPSWHPSGRSFAYSTIRVGEAPPRVLVRELDGGRSWSTRVASMNITPAFSPDGSSLIFAAGSDGFDLYSVVPFSQEAPRRLTSRRSSLNTTPTFSPDGARVVFMSDLIGHPELYIMDADGSNPDLLTDQGFGDRLYRSDPSWQPAGRRVAYQSKVNDVFQLMTISVSDRSVSQITSEGANEDPSWAPDGRHIVFVSTRAGGAHLFVLDTESSRTRQLTRGSKAQNPAWSPRLELSRQP
jgi:TolB protein